MKGKKDENLNKPDGNCILNIPTIAKNKNKKMKKNKTKEWMIDMYLCARREQNVRVPLRES